MANFTYYDKLRRFSRHIIAISTLIIGFQGIIIAFYFNQLHRNAIYLVIVGCIFGFAALIYLIQPLRSTLKSSYSGTELRYTRRMLIRGVVLFVIGPFAALTASHFLDKPNMEPVGCSKIVAGLDSITAAIHESSIPSQNLDSLPLITGGDSLIADRLDSVTAAIRSLTDETTVVTTKSDSGISIPKWALIVMAIGIIIFSIGIILVAVTSHVKKGRTAMAIGLTMGGISLFSLEVDDFHLINLDLNVGIPIAQVSSTPSDLWIEKLTVITPFESGASIPSNMSAINCLSDEIKHEMIKYDLVAIELIGCTDRDNLGAILREKYGYNSGLAAARAEWVRNSLIERDSCQLKNTKFTIKITGPTSKDSPAIDRRVEAYAWWKNK
ncbi:MAG: hypothetical protein GY841_17880 [FCB group bacterium]|nr:hypothetical protein [FCB group bacterium]